ncbi:hypothetical protein [Burkholderia lata]|uniref:hypothetical protein n=1 Tax=Burkholderia lata (strain ATCC 17760 / DSM 23089 / LMG 22485 / NCIMB 9086 / R18194 / 383) TaxID=482957 RepID=UPI001583D20D|nr:hypothetical protein [Burkholderia lata]
MKTVSLFSTENRVASANGPAIRADLVGESVIKEPLERIEPKVHAFQADASVKLSGVVANADLHPVVAREFRDCFEVEPVDNLGIERGEFDVRYKATFHALLHLIRDRELWSIAARAPRRTFGYAKKYAAKTAPTLDQSRGLA